MTTTSSLDLTTSTLVDIAAAVVSGTATPTDVAEASLARIAALEDKVQAWCYLDPADVRAQAAVLTDELRAGKLRGPLHGVPFGVKDEFHVQGQPTYMADPVGRPQPVDATTVAKLRAAGAIIMGKTHMPIDGKLPPTRNPWNLEHTAGGTSSGSGAVVGARMVPAALGEQTAGSNLRPAAFCGVAALKPTYGRLSRFGMYPFAWSHDHAGIIGLTMEDIALVFNALAGPDPLDPTTRTEGPSPATLSIEGMRAPRIGIVRNFFPERTQPVMLEAIETSAATLRSAGATVTDILLPEDFGLVWMAHRLVGGAEGLTLRGRRYNEGALPMIGRDLAASLVPATYYLQAQRVRRYLWTKLQALFGEVDALLMAVSPTPAPKGIATTGDASLLVPWSCLGYPAITINGGLSPEGLPLGLQFVAGPMSDYGLLRTGAWCEEVLGRLPAPAVG